MSTGPNALIEKCCAHSVTSVADFPSRFNSSWAKNDVQEEVMEDISQYMLLQLMPGRKLSSRQLRMALNCSNSIVFSELYWMITNGVLEKIGPDKYARKSL